MRHPAVLGPVTVRRPGGFSPIGGDPLPSTDHEIEGCIWWPRTSDERTDMRNTVISGWMLAAPFDADIRPTDKVLLPDVLDDDGNLDPLAVDGDIGPWRSPYRAGAKVGLTVALKRVTG